MRDMNKFTASRFVFRLNAGEGKLENIVLKASFPLALTFYVVLELSENGATASRA